MKGEKEKWDKNWEKVEACWRKGLRLREIQIIIDRWATAFPPRWTSSHLFFSATILPNPLVRALCVLSSLFPGLPLQIYSQFDFFYPLLLPHLRHIPLPLKSPLHLLSPFALSPVISPAPLSPSPWGRSITAATGDASQLTLWHPSKLTLCNPHIFWQCLYFMTIRLFDLCPLDKHQTKL